MLASLKRKSQDEPINIDAGSLASRLADFKKTKTSDQPRARNIVYAGSSKGVDFKGIVVDIYDKNKKTRVKEIGKFDQKSPASIVVMVNLETAHINKDGGVSWKEPGVLQIPSAMQVEGEICTKFGIAPAGEPQEYMQMRHQQLIEVSAYKNGPFRLRDVVHLSGVYAHGWQQEGAKGSIKTGMNISALSIMKSEVVIPPAMIDFYNNYYKFLDWLRKNTVYDSIAPWDPEMPSYETYLVPLHASPINKQENVVPCRSYVSDMKVTKVEDHKGEKKVDLVVTLDVYGNVVMNPRTFATKDGDIINADFNVTIKCFGEAAYFLGPCQVANFESVKFMLSHPEFKGYTLANVNRKDTEATSLNVDDFGSDPRFGLLTSARQVYWNACELIPKIGLPIPVTFVRRVFENVAMNEGADSTKLRCVMSGFENERTNTTLLNSSLIYLNEIPAVQVTSIAQSHNFYLVLLPKYLVELVADIEKVVPGVFVINAETETVTQVVPKEKDAAAFQVKLEAFYEELFKKITNNNYMNSKDKLVHFYGVHPLKPLQDLPETNRTLNEWILEDKELFDVFKKIKGEIEPPANKRLRTEGPPVVVAPVGDTSMFVDAPTE